MNTRPPDPGAIAGYRLAAVERLAGAATSGLLLLCDHASNAVPPELGALGLPSGEFERHIAYDIGADGVTRHLAELSHAPALMTRVSRLVIDCNRAADDPTLIMQLSDRAIVPGNRNLAAAERQARIARYYRPYHDAIGATIDAMSAAAMPPVLLSIHSFTPCWKGTERRWHAGVLWDKDPRLAEVLLNGLSAEPALVVGDNEPYSGRLFGDTLYQHGTTRGLAHAILEIRQDLIATEQGQRAWAARIAAILTAALANGAANHDLNSIRFYGSHTGP